MKRIFIYLLICISIFSNETKDTVNEQEQRIKDLIYEKIQIDYNFSKRNNKLDFAMLNYLYNYMSYCSCHSEKYDTRVFDFFISKGLNINSTDPDFLSELLNVTINPEIFDFFIKKGLKYDRVLNNSYSILIPFIYNNYPEEYIFNLINNGAKLSENPAYKYSELFLAVNKNYSEKLIGKLIEEIKDKKDLAYSALLYLSYEPDADELNSIKKIIRYLQKEKVDLDNYKLFSMALEKNCTDIEFYEILFDGGLSLKTKQNWNTLLALAVSTGNTVITEFLLKKGANPNALEKGRHILEYSNNDEVHELLIKYGAKK